MILKYEKLSEAIKIGIEMRPNKIRKMMIDDKDGACALGCAIVANGLQMKSEFSLRKFFPVLNRKINHPLISYEWDVASIIEDLNDYQCWSREQIAEWVEKIEKEV